MQEPEEKPRWHFVDEAGDPAFYAKRSKRIIVGEEGCSRTLILGFIRTRDPQQIRSKLAEVRLAVSADRYLRDIPSVKKSLIYFHAKDDCVEVRKLVFDALDKMDFHAQVIVARKLPTLFRTKYRSSQIEFYDDLVTKLFKNQLHLATENYITFARRGKKARQNALRQAVEKAAEVFRKTFQHDTVTKIIVETSQPVQESALQAIDYVNWAVQRAFERGEMRYFEFLRNKIEVVWDVFDFDKYEGKGGGCVYDRKRNPFDIKKASPLS
jgi:hypothetical protein